MPLSAVRSRFFPYTACRIVPERQQAFSVMKAFPQNLQTPASVLLSTSSGAEHDGHIAETIGISEPP